MIFLDFIVLSFINCFEVLQSNSFYKTCLFRRNSHLRVLVNFHEDSCPQHRYRFRYRYSCKCGGQKIGKMRKWRNWKNRSFHLYLQVTNRLLQKNNKHSSRTAVCNTWCRCCLEKWSSAPRLLSWHPFSHIQFWFILR